MIDPNRILDKCVNFFLGKIPQNQNIDNFLNFIGPRRRPGKKKILVRIWMLSHENWGSYNRLNISKKKKKKSFPWGRSGGKKIFRPPAPLIKAVRAFEIQEIGRFRAYIREKRGCFAAPFFANIWPRFARPSWPRPSWPRPRGRPLKVLYIYEL